MPKALIVGINGQDGAYLARQLLVTSFFDYEVHGIRRHASVDNQSRLREILTDRERSRLKIHVGDITDAGFVDQVIRSGQYDEVYNLAAQSDVPVSFDAPDYTFRVNTLGTLNLLTSIRATQHPARFYQASTSELFGISPAPQDESSAMVPQSPYAVAKLAAYHLVKQYRQGYGLFACNGILFNHESPYRGDQFVTAKVCMAAAKAMLGRDIKLVLGNLDASRDWGHAADYVRGMWQMMQLPRPGDYVLATGRSHTVRQLVDIAFRIAKVPLKWMSDDLAINTKTNAVLVTTNKQYLRPLEVPSLRGLAYKAKADFGWEPTYSFESMIEEMVNAFCARLEAGQPD